MFMGFSAAASVGAMLAVALSLNARLGAHLNSAFKAATFSAALSSGALLLLAIVLREHLPTLEELTSVPLHAWLGGPFGAAYLVMTVMLIHRLGAATTGGAQIVGQMLASLFIDWTGLFGVSIKDPGLGQFAGILVATAAVFMISQGRGNSGNAAKHLFAIAVAVVAGFLVPMQAGVNADLRQAIHAPMLTSMISFFLASMLIYLAGLSFEKKRSAATPHRQVAFHWWGWTGGLFAATYVTVMMLLLPVIGASGAIGFGVAGQQLGAAAIDHAGAFGLAKQRISAFRAAGIALLLAGVALIKMS